jgi:hypothetical protein
LDCSSSIALTAKAAAAPATVTQNTGNVDGVASTAESTVLTVKGKVEWDQKNCYRQKKQKPFHKSTTSALVLSFSRHRLDISAVL